MSNENSNNDFHWKGKLEGLESLPGETFNKEGAWNRLHERMQEKNSKKKAIWYWAAAACLVIALLTSWFLSMKDEPALVKNNSAKEKGQPAISQDVITNMKDSIVSISPTSVKRKIDANSIENTNKIFAPVSHKTPVVENIAIKKNKEEFITPEINNNSSAPVDAQMNIIAVIPAKKKLRVVHINELGDPMEEAPAVAHKTDIHSFQMQFGNQEVFVNPSIASKKTGFVILKTKNSPN